MSDIVQKIKIQNYHLKVLNIKRVCYEITRKKNHSSKIETTLNILKTLYLMLFSDDFIENLKVNERN